MHLNVEELYAILDAAREREHRHNKFMAALKGIDIDAANKEDIQERFDAVQRRADSKLTGKSVDAIEYDELGFDIETD